MIEAPIIDVDIGDNIARVLRIDKVGARIEYCVPMSINEMNEVIKSMKDKQIKPCRFCGNKDQNFLSVIKHLSGSFAVWCEVCGAYGPSWTKRERAIDTWNNGVKVD